ncbi:hypothetical protein ACFL2U_00805 [Patescibacteria group bacterium]
MKEKKSKRKHELIREFVSLPRECKSSLSGLHLRFTGETNSAHIQLNQKEFELLCLIYDALSSPIIVKLFGKIIDPEIFTNILLKYAKAGARVGQKSTKE